MPQPVQRFFTLVNDVIIDNQRNGFGTSVCASQLAYRLMNKPEFLCVNTDRIVSCYLGPESGLFNIHINSGIYYFYV